MSALSKGSRLKDPIVPLLVAITLLKLALANIWGWTYDIPQMRYSAEAFLAGQDILDPANTHGNHAFFPIGHHIIAAAALRLAYVSDIPFAFLIKVPAIFADLIIALLLKSTVRGGDRAALLYLLNPVTFLLSVYHGQLHTVATAGVVLTLWLAERKRLYSSAIVFGLAVSVRQHFAVLAIPIITMLKTAGDRLRFAGPLAATLIIINAALLTYARPDRLFSPAIQYGAWGYSMLLLQVPRVLGLLGFGATATAMADLNQIVILLSARINLLWAILFSGWIVAQSRLRKLDLWREALLYVLGMCALTPGIGVQWLVWAVPFWLVIDPRGAIYFNVLAGAFIAGSYWQWTLNAKYQVYSLTAHLDLVNQRDFSGVLLVGLLGLLTWLHIVGTAWRLAVNSPMANEHRTAGEGAGA